MQNIGAQTPAPEISAPVPADVVEPNDVEPLWQELSTLFSALNRDRLSCGRILHELNERYAVPGHGSFCKRVMALGFFKNIQTAYNWMNLYRKHAGITPPKPFEESEIEEGDSISVSEDQPDAPTVEREQPTGTSFTAWVTLQEKKRLESLIRRIVTFGMINKQTTSFGKVIDNKNDALVWAVELVGESQEVMDFFEQEEKKHHENSPQ